jgi:hypothetical protein
MVLTVNIYLQESQYSKLRVPVLTYLVSCTKSSIEVPHWLAVILTYSRDFPMVLLCGEPAYAGDSKHNEKWMNWPNAQKTNFL